MKKLLLLTVLSFAVHVTFAKEDSLIARIGTKAKVAFYAERPEDLKEIEKYDLNLLFRQLKRRAEKNFTFSEDVTLKDADELKNREANTVVKPRKWFRDMNLNLYVGSSRATIQGYRNKGLDTYSHRNSHFLGIPHKEIHNSKYVVRDLFYVDNVPTTMFGIGGYFDKTIWQKRKTEVSLRYGAGFDFINTKMKLVRNGIIVISDDSTTVPIPFGNQLPEVKKNGILSTNLFAELQPTLNLINSKGVRTFKFGVGIKVAASLNSFNKNTFTDDYLYLTDGPMVSLKYKALQTAFTATVGYKFVNLFLQVIPNNIVITGAQFPAYFPFESPHQINATSYAVGLRFGK